MEKPKFSCKECRRQFVENPSNKIIPHNTWNLIDKLLLEKISSVGISRVTGISEVWIQNYINKKYEHVPKRTEDVFKKSGLILQCDEIWSFVKSKERKVWIWLAMDRYSRRITGVYAGSRDKEGALGLWNSLSESCKKDAVFYTDFWSAYKEIFPQGRHFSVGKDSGKTSHIERFNLTLRQLVSRLEKKRFHFLKI